MLLPLFFSFSFCIDRGLASSNRRRHLRKSLGNPIHAHYRSVSQQDKNLLPQSSKLVGSVQTQYGQIAPVYSISAGLDYPGVGPEHSYLHDIGRAEYVPVTDEEAVGAFEYLARTEGIIPAIESAHAVAHGMKIAPAMETDKIVVITISGRGDKDCASIARYRGENIYE